MALISSGSGKSAKSSMSARARQQKKMNRGYGKQFGMIRRPGQHFGLKPVDENAENEGEDDNNDENDEDNEVEEGDGREDEEEYEYVEEEEEGGEGEEEGEVDEEFYDEEKAKMEKQKL